MAFGFGRWKISEAGNGLDAILPVQKNEAFHTEVLRLNLMTFGTGQAWTHRPQAVQQSALTAYACLLREETRLLLFHGSAHGIYPRPLQPGPARTAISLSSPPEPISSPRHAAQRRVRAERSRRRG